MAAINVTPITQGYAFTFTLQFTLPNASALFASPNPVPARIRGEFRSRANPLASNNPLLAAVDTTTGNLTINSDGSLTMSLTEAQTAALPLGPVLIDFARVDGGVSTPVGVTFNWPVIAPVTAAPT